MTEALEYSSEGFIKAIKQNFKISAKGLVVLSFLLWFKCILNVFNLHPEVL